MEIDNKRKKILEQFNLCLSKYEDSMRYLGSENSKIKRAFYGLNMFGFSYLVYSMSRLKIPRLFGNIHSKFFFDRKMVWPINDIGANVFSLFGILPHKSERKLTLWTIKNLKDDEIFYDVGAHLGYYTALSEKILKKGEIHAFEANKKLCKYLNKNFSNSKNVSISCTAIADSIKDVNFYDATKTEDSSTSSRFNLSGGQIIPSKIHAITLDSYVKKGNKAPTVIKFDIEGGEHDAIIGATNIIKEYKPMVVMEVLGDKVGRKFSDKAVKKLLEFGYNAFQIKSNGSVSKDVINDPVTCVRNSRDNFLFLPI